MLAMCAVVCAQEFEPVPMNLDPELLDDDVAEEVEPEAPAERQRREAEKRHSQTGWDDGRSRN